MLIGVFKLNAKLLACSTQCCFCCLNVALIIVTGVTRFNTKGSLSAISLTGTTPLDTVGDFKVSTETTYEMDGKLIMGIWVFQLIFYCFHCCGVCYVTATPSKA